jgi:hypothetical protein
MPNHQEHISLLKRRESSDRFSTHTYSIFFGNLCHLVQLNRNLIGTSDGWFWRLLSCIGRVKPCDPMKGGGICSFTF